MTLKITKEDEIIEVHNICMTIYAQPGLGKTSLSFTALNPIMFDFDKGSHRAVDRKDVVQVESWKDVAGVTANDLADYDTIILDTVGKALDFLAQDIIKSNNKLGYSGALNQQGWGQLGVRFKAFLDMLQSFGKDIVLISHMDEKADGDTIKERLKIQGGSKDLVHMGSDVMGRIVINNGLRYLTFTPTDTAFGKDPAGIGIMQIPDATAKGFPDFLGNLIDDVKTSLNSLSEAQVERKSEVEWFTNALPDIKDAEGINNLLGRAKKVGRDVSQMLVERAKELQLEYDPTAKKYVYLEEATSEEAA